ncbi:MAG TPA: hypothetical protein VMU55_03635, partial [Solirubrobacteraceae bacterium]|nr:hypothetical protein [Solirubrobacteraceae bacterium]
RFTALSSGQRIPLVHLSIGFDYVCDATINPGLAQSLLSEGAFADLVHWDIVNPLEKRQCVLRDLKIQGQRLPDLSVRVSRATRRFGVDVVFGFDFFQNFIEARYDLRSNALTLVDP